MKDFKGTKGKWKFWLGNSTYKVTDTLFRDVLNIEELNNIDEAEANAQLIATAPEMLEVLQKFQELFLEYDMQPEDEMHEYACEVDNVINKALNHEPI